MSRATAIALTIALLPVFSRAVRAADSHQAVFTISQGALAGQVDAHGVRCCKDIPYARLPVGDLRGVHRKRLKVGRESNAPRTSGITPCSRCI
jgi:hypothetical protein